MTLSEKIRDDISDPETRPEYVRDLFGRIARRYDLTNDVMSLGLHRRWKRRLLELAEIRPEHTVLDLAAGTGDLAAGAIRSGAGTVVAADLTPGMMRVGRDRLSEADSISWVCGDALCLPLPAASVDRVLIGYGLRNFADLDASLNEILRCLRPGGRMLALDFGRPSSPAFRRAYLAYLSGSTRAVGWVLHRDIEAYLYIPESLKRYEAQRGVLERMRTLGFVRCGFVEFLFGAMALNFGERPEADP